MSVKNNLQNLSEYWRGRLLRISRKLLKRHRNVHTILLGRVCDVCDVRGDAESACEFHNFRFFVFLDEERDRVTREIREPSLNLGEGGVVVSEKYTVYEPGMGYKNITGSLMASVERHGRVSFRQNLRQEHLEYLNTHCQHFTCKDFPEIVTLNMMEMKRDDVRFFRYYLTGKFDTGYLVYNREMKPIISLN